MKTWEVVAELQSKIDHDQKKLLIEIDGQVYDVTELIAQSENRIEIRVKTEKK